MQKIIATALLAGTAFAIVTPAFAQSAGAWIDPSSTTGVDSPSSQIMYGNTSAASWTGFYAGANLAYGAGSIATNAPGNPTNDLRGFAGGVQAGANLDLGGLVIGGEADAQLSNINYSVLTGGVVTSSYSMDYYASARIRAGFAYGQFMPYVTAGLAAGQGTSKFSALGGTFSQSNLHTGWTAGAGVEYALNESLSIKAEYLYTDLGTKNYFSGFGTPQDATFRFGTFRIGANFRF